MLFFASFAFFAFFASSATYAPLDIVSSFVSEFTSRADDSTFSISVRILLETLNETRVTIREHVSDADACPLIVLLFSIVPIVP